MMNRGDVWLTMILRLLLATVFLISSVGKLLSPSEFLSFVEGTPLLHTIDGKILLYTITGFELLCVALLLRSHTGKIGNVLSFVLLLIFTLVMMLLAHQGSQASCGCFGALLNESSIDISILRNAVLLLLSVILMALQRGELRHGIQ